MKINTRTRYAIRLLADIYKNGGSEPVSLKAVAKRQHLSERYLGQLALHLRNASLIKSVLGNSGGYKLARPGSEIRILDIIEAVDGPVSILDCVTDKDICPKYDYCECKTLWTEMNDALVSIMAGYTLEHLFKVTNGAPEDACANKDDFTIKAC